MIPSCKQTSLLLSQAQDRPLSLTDRLRLRERRKSGMCGSGQREILPVQAFNLGAQCLR